MINLQFRFINRSGAMVVSDPSVERGEERCLLYKRARKGVWCVEFIFDNKHCLILLKAVHEDARIMSSMIEERDLKTDSNQIGIFDCSEEFLARGKEKVEKAVEAYNLFYNDPDFVPENYFINLTL